MIDNLSERWKFYGFSKLLKRKNKICHALVISSKLLILPWDRRLISVSPIKRPRFPLVLIISRIRALVCVNASSLYYLTENPNLVVYRYIFLRDRPFGGELAEKPLEPASDGFSYLIKLIFVQFTHFINKALGIEQSDLRKVDTRFSIFDNAQINIMPSFFFLPC